MATNMRLTRLTAVNRILRGAGENPVNSLSADGLNDTALAEAVLDEVNVTIQLRGLTANTQIETRNMDADGFIQLPDNCLRALGSGDDVDRVFVMRGSPPKLYDVQESTFVFTAAVELELVMGLDFDALPPAHQFEIVDNAARLYQAQTVGDRGVDGMLNEISQLSRIQSRRQDILNRNSSILRPDRSAGQAVRRTTRSTTTGL